MSAANPFDTYRQLHENPSSGFGVDSVSLDIPLLIRIMEVCREEIKDDKELHQFATLIVAAKDRGVLGMKDWNDIYTFDKKGEEDMKESVNPGMANKHLAAAKFHHGMAHYHAQKNHELQGNEHHLDAMVDHGDKARMHAKHAKTHGATPKQLADHAGHYADGIGEEAKITEAASNPAHHAADFAPGDKKGYAAHMKTNFGVRTTFHGTDKLKFHGPVHKVRQALEYHYGNFDDAARKHKHLYPASYLRKSL
jgi:hypothetical protein